MKKWYYWLFLSLAFAVGGLINYANGRQLTATVFQVSVTAAMAGLQFLCDRKGEKGRKVFKYLCIVVIALLILCVLYLVMYA